MSLEAFHSNHNMPMHMSTLHNLTQLTFDCFQKSPHFTTCICPHLPLVSLKGRHTSQIRMSTHVHTLQPQTTLEVYRHVGSLNGHAAAAAGGNACNRHTVNACNRHIVDPDPGRGQTSLPAQALGWKRGWCLLQALTPKSLLQTRQVPEARCLLQALRRVNSM